MAAANPYALDPLLAQGFSNLTSALIGDPQSDVYGAKADLLRQQVQQSKASENASNSLAALRAEQRRLEALKTARYGDLQRVASEPSAALANAMLTTLGYQDAEMDALGNVVKIQPEGAPLQSVPYKIDPTTGTGTDLGVNNLTNAMFGNLDFTPNQFASALTELGAGRQSSLARAILLDPDASIAAKAGAFQSMGKSPGEFFDPSFANSKLVQTLASNEKTSAATDTSNLKGTKYNADAVYDAAAYEDDLRYGKGGQGDRDSNDKLTWENYKADRVFEASKYNTDETVQLGKYKHDNRTIEIEVGQDKVLTLDPDSGKRVGIEPNSDGLYQIIGPKTLDVVKVSVGQADMYMDENLAEALNVPLNDDGQYVIKGAGYASSAGAGNKSLQYTLSEFNTAYGQTAESVEDYSVIPQNVRANLKSILSGYTSAALTAGEYPDKNASFQANVTQIIGQGVKVLDAKGAFTGNFGVPIYFFKIFQTAPNEAREAAKELGYSDDQIKIIMDNL